MFITDDITFEQTEELGKESIDLYFENSKKVMDIMLSELIMVTDYKYRQDKYGKESVEPYENICKNIVSVTIRDEIGLEGLVAKIMDNIGGFFKKVFSKFGDMFIGKGRLSWLKGYSDSFEEVTFSDKLLTKLNSKGGIGYIHSKKTIDKYTELNLSKIPNSIMDFSKDLSNVKKSADFKKVFKIFGEKIDKNVIKIIDNKLNRTFDSNTMKLEKKPYDKVSNTKVKSFKNKDKIIEFYSNNEDDLDTMLKSDLTLFNKMNDGLKQVVKNKDNAKDNNEKEFLNKLIEVYFELNFSVVQGIYSSLETNFYYVEYSIEQFRETKGI